jgi:hypothetical protein
MKKREISILLIILVLLFISATLLYLYSNEVNFIGEIKWSPENAIQKIETRSALNRKQTIFSNDKYLAGYFREIVFTKKYTSADPVISQSFTGNSTQLSYIRISGNIFKLVNPELGFFSKATAIIYYNFKNLIIIFSVLLLTFIILRNFKRIGYQIKNVLIKLRTGFVDGCNFIWYHKSLTIASMLVSLLIYPCLFYLFGINFSTLYNIPHNVMYLFVSAIFFIPIFGFFMRNKSGFFGIGFFSFWLIFLLHYFIISPFLFAGNFGFHGFFHDFLHISLHKGFFESLIVPDTGYIAILPRMVYGLAICLSPDASQSIAITSLASLVVYSSIFGFFACKKFKFLWPSAGIRLIYVVLIAIFPIFSLVPGFCFRLSITDTAYYGILFSFMLLFVISDFKLRSVYLFTLINCLFILSKAHFITLLPLYVIALIVFVRYKNRKGLILTFMSLLAIITQLIYCFFSAAKINVHNSSESFSINTLGFGEQVFVAFSYYIKSYIYILFPFAGTTGKNAIILICLTIIIIIILIFLAIKMVKKSRYNLVALWFIAGNILAFSASAFYAYSIPHEVHIIRNNIISLIKSVDLNIMRYTIGIHTILAVAVVPFIIYLFSELFKHFIPKYTLKACFVLFFIFVTNGFVFNNAAISFPHFWRMTKDDLWSYEWKQLSPLLKNKDYYIPVVFYPAYKQAMMTKDLEVSNDFIPKKQSGFSLEGQKNVHAIILLNSSGNKEKEVPMIAETFHKCNKISQLKPYYSTSHNMRFIYFLNEKTVPVDSVVFLNHMHEPIKINTHIRIVSKTKK